MKIFKYVTIALAALTMTVAFNSCDKEVDPDVDAKENFWFDFQLTNTGSLNEASQTRFAELVDSVIYGEKGAIHYPMYCTKDYAVNNFNKIVALPNDKSDIVQKIMLPVAKIQKVRDFEMTMSLKKDQQETIVTSKVFKASEVLANEDLN